MRRIEGQIITMMMMTAMANHAFSRDLQTQIAGRTEYARVEAFGTGVKKGVTVAWECSGQWSQMSAWRAWKVQGVCGKEKEVEASQEKSQASGGGGGDGRLGEGGDERHVEVSKAV